MLIILPLLGVPSIQEMVGRKCMDELISPVIACYRYVYYLIWCALWYILGIHFYEVSGYSTGSLNAPINNIYQRYPLSTSF